MRSSPERSEQRAANRTRLEVEVTFDSESQFFSGITRDVSRGGMFVATYRTLPVGQSILLDFSLPSGERIATAGTVCWVREGGSEQEASPGMGIAFEALVQRDYALIEEFCTAREPLYIDLDAPNDDSE